MPTMPTTSNLEIAKPFTLPCGLVLPNRLVKAAMTEEMGHGDRLPNDAICALYRTWAQGNWGMILTSAVHIDAAHAGSHAALTIDASLPPSTTHAAFHAWAQACHGDGNSQTPTPSILQIHHPGRQSPLGAGKRPLLAKAIAPSAIPLDLGPGLIARAAGHLVFGTPRAMTVEEIQSVVAQFAAAARIAAETGFDGCQIHAAHGYLLAQFLSGEGNVREDDCRFFFSFQYFL